MTKPMPASPVAAIECIRQAKIDALKPHWNRKKIFVFCDGTGNMFAPTRDQSANSNVVKLYTTLRVTNNQVAYYHPGVGTMGDPAIRWRIPRFWSMAKGLAFGAGFQACVLDAYRYLMEVYNDGDEIYIFGFSRGAYAARALGGLLHGYGLLCRGNEGHLPYVWKMFHDESKKKRKALKDPRSSRQERRAHTVKRNFAFSETFSRKVTIRFMGVWDTVSSVGWIYDPLRLIDMAQNPAILVGRHAVSIDERRAFYRDNLWGRPVSIKHPEWPDKLRDQGIRQDIVQVWFPGVHSDIGGSYPQWEAAPANEALRWMIRELQNNGAELCQERIDMVLGTKSGDYGANRIYTPAPKLDHCIHQSLKGPFWWLLQCVPQQYYDKEDAIIQWRTPYGTPRHLPNGAIVHPSAVRRLNTTTSNQQPYQPRNLTLAQIKPMRTLAWWTTADLQGCFIYRPRLSPPPPPDSTFKRLTKVFIGWATLGLLAILVSAILWYFLRLFLFLVMWVIWLSIHSPSTWNFVGKLFHVIRIHLW